MRVSWRARGAGPIAALAMLLCVPPPASANSVARSKTPIRVVAEEVIDDLFNTLWKRPAPVSRDFRAVNGLFGLGGYRPPGMIDGGLKAPPIHLSPSARLGNSLNVDPVTGRSFFQ